MYPDNQSISAQTADLSTKTYEVDASQSINTRFKKGSIQAAAKGKPPKNMSVDAGLPKVKQIFKGNKKNDRSLSHVYPEEEIKQQNLPSEINKAHIRGSETRKDSSDNH